MLLGLSNDKAFDGSYIVADNEALSVKNLFEYIAEIIGAKKPISIPQNLVPLFTSIPFIGKRFSFLLKDRFYSIKRIKEELEYRPKVSVYEGLKRAVLSYK
jgi:nucleoside-diphosphate-sugar epimerase